MFQDSTNRKRFISGNLSAGSVSGNVSQTKRFRKRFRKRVPNVYEKSRAKKSGASGLWPGRCSKVRALAYHGEHDLADRRAVQAAFAANEAQCVVATVAFGMGVDKRDIRRVVPMQE